jgi:hypothetical protein
MCVSAGYLRIRRSDLVSDDGLTAVPFSVLPLTPPRRLWRIFVWLTRVHCFWRFGRRLLLAVNHEDTHGRKPFAVSPLLSTPFLSWARARFNHLTCPSTKPAEVLDISAAFTRVIELTCRLSFHHPGGVSGHIRCLHTSD